MPLKLSPLYYSCFFILQSCFKIFICLLQFYLFYLSFTIDCENDNQQLFSYLTLMTCKSINDFEGILLGYYPLRGTVQVCRLLCQYLKLPYKDLLFTPQTWEEFKVTQNLKWNYQQLPFLKEGDFVVTQTFPICLYLVHRADRKDLLGNSLGDQIKVDMFVWDTDIMTQILGLLASFKEMSTEKKYQIFDSFWHKKLKSKLVKIEREIQGSYYASSLTIVDFYIYDLYEFFKIALIEIYMNQFPKITLIHHNIDKIPEISAYEKSAKAIKNICPAGFYEKWRSMCNREGSDKQ